MSAFEAELTVQMRLASDSARAAELVGDELLATAMQDRLDDLADIAARHRVSG